MEPNVFIQTAYQNAVSNLGSSDLIQVTLPANIRENAQMILDNSESSKGVLTVIITSLAYKILHPEQDIRRHQSSIENGYSGRTFDNQYITPFLKQAKFPAMAESGWLTRSLEQKVPYDENYSGAIRPSKLKSAFLNIINEIETDIDCENLLQFLLQGLILKRNAQNIELAKPVSLPINRIIAILSQHFGAHYNADGASRLPVLALYAAYQCLLPEVKRYSGTDLLSLESHTSADTRSGRIGDIDILDERGHAFEAVEIKHGIAINKQLIVDAYEKFKTTQVSRYYLLSTANIDLREEKEICEEIERIKHIHGCQVIANGLISSLKYYLRLISDTSEFIANYVDLVDNDSALKFEHKEKWNIVVSTM